MATRSTARVRCEWANSHELLTSYHDQEWGVPVREDRLLFEMLNLEGAQAGLSWLTVLKKRDAYRRAFQGFDARKLVKFTAKDQARLMKDEGIVRNRLKISAVVGNAKAFLEVQRELGSFADYMWKFTEGKTLRGPENERAVEASERMSKELKKRGFRFVGPTICYAFMQGVGMVNDHSAKCFRSKKLRA